MAGFSGSTFGKIKALLTGKADITDNFVSIANTSYTIQTTDNGKILRFTSNNDIAVICGNNIPVGFNCIWRQTANGRITFTGGVGVTLRNSDNYTKSYSKYSEGGLTVDLSGEWYLSGAYSS